MFKTTQVLVSSVPIFAPNQAAVRRSIVEVVLDLLQILVYYERDSEPPSFRELNLLARNS